eukprot:g4263.t1
MRGPADAPQALRAALHCDSANSFCEQGLDVLFAESDPAVPLVSDWGDLFEPTPQEVDGAVRAVLDGGLVPVVLGGDHSVTFPTFRALARWRRDRNNTDPARPRPLCIVHFDAHPDLYHELGDLGPLSHASPFARIMECTHAHAPRWPLGDAGRATAQDSGALQSAAPICDQLLQIGIRTANAHQRAQARRFGVRTLEARHVCSGGASSIGAFLRAHLPRNADVYVSLDLDVLDPAYAPGVSHHEPGGLSTRQVIEGVSALAAGPVGEGAGAGAGGCGGGIEGEGEDEGEGEGEGWRIVGLDVVELNPVRDAAGVTAMAGAKLLRELLGAALVLEGRGGGTVAGSAGGTHNAQAASASSREAQLGPTPPTAHAAPPLPEREYAVLLCTVPDRAAGDRLAASLLAASLAACVNIVPGVVSHYLWQGRACADSEELLVVKSRRALVRDAAAHIEREHPYDVPELVALPIVGGSEPYLAWIGESTGGEGG